ncbi:MAG: hypothetical protein JXQ99_16275 [Hyphomicrobiaceae bacterium]
MTNSPVFEQIWINLRPVPEDYATYCVLTGQFCDIAEISREHPLPLILGGNDKDFFLCTSKAINNKIGSRVEQVVARDPIVMFGRRDAKAKGHRKTKSNIPKFRNVSLVQPHKKPNIFDAPRDFQIESRRPQPIVKHSRSQTILPQSVFNDHCAFTTFNRPIAEMIKLVLKVTVCMGWRLFGPSIESCWPIETMRNALNPDSDLDNYWGDELSWAWETERFKPEMQDYIDANKAASVRRHRSTFMISEHDGMIECTLTCLGYFTGSIQFSSKQRLMADLTEMDQRLVIIFERKRYFVERELAQA